jgi:integrase
MRRKLMPLHEEASQGALNMPDHNSLPSLNDVQPLNLSEVVRVSARSVFTDKKWDFTDEIDNDSLGVEKKVIDWDFPMPEGRNSFDPIYSTTLLTLRELAYAMLFQTKPKKYVTVASVIAPLKIFVRYLSERPTPILRFQDALESDVEGYIDKLKSSMGRNGLLCTGTLSRHLEILNKLFEYRDFLTDPLAFRPTKSDTPQKVAGVRYNGSRTSTQAIPDNELRELIDLAADYIERQSPLMFECLEEFYQFCAGQDFSGFKREVKSLYIGRNFFAKQPHFRSGPELNTALVHLRTACLIMVAFCTGMRISEVMATRRGCIRQEQDPNHGTFYWLDSKLFKTQKDNAGSPRSWMCGRLAAQAVTVMERMGELLGAPGKTQHLFIAFTYFSIIKRINVRKKIKCLSVRKAAVDLKGFCRFHKLGTDLRIHRLRRSFAKNIIRFSSTSILALKDHFKHWSLYMTDWYIGLDANLLEELEAERLLLSIEAMDKICTQPVGGAGGRRWMQELEARIASGKLPRNFKGNAGAEFRKSMIKDVHESGLIVVPCGDFTFCIFQKDSALCTNGNRPLVNLCNPFDCTNSYILPEHVPFYRGKLTYLEEVYNELSENQKIGLGGLFYLREIRKIKAVLKPFAN